MDTQQFDRKRLALVGNSRRLLECADGNEIDAHDVIVRFNLAWPERAGKLMATGTRTTHMMVGGREFRTAEKAVEFAHLRRRCPDVVFFSAKGDPQRWTLRSPVPLLPDDVFGGWQAAADTDAEPTSGMTLLYYLVTHCRPRSVALYGFDGLKSPVWTQSRPHLHAQCHSSDAESRYLDRIVRDISHFTKKLYDPVAKDR